MPPASSRPELQRRRPVAGQHQLHSGQHLHEPRRKTPFAPNTPSTTLPSGHDITPDRPCGPTISAPTTGAGQLVTQVDHYLGQTIAYTWDLAASWCTSASAKAWWITTTPRAPWVAPSAPSPCWTKSRPDSQGRLRLVSDATSVCSSATTPPATAPWWRPTRWTNTGTPVNKTYNTFGYDAMNRQTARQQPADDVRPGGAAACAGQRL